MKRFVNIFFVVVICFRGMLSQQITPTDAKFGEQWYLYHQGVPESQRADIRAPEAWYKTQGNPNLRIAIIESINSSDPNSGIVNSAHPDLAGRIVNHSSNQLSSHANSVAGVIIANKTNDPINGGIVGINWNSLLNAYYFDDIEDELDVRIGDAIIDGNKIINISRGYDQHNISQVMLANTYNNNITVIKSMGNLGITSYPINTALISVGASTKENTVATYSNSGYQISFLAPGGAGAGSLNEKNILTTDAIGYFYTSGTSLAAPMVTGSVSLLLSYRNDLCNDDLKNLLTISCDKLPEMQGQNFTEQHGYGRINLKKAFEYLKSPYQLNHFSVNGGIINSTTGWDWHVLFNIPGLGSGPYICRIHEVIKTVTIPSYFDHYVWGTSINSNGYSKAEPNYGRHFCEILSYTSTSVTLRTYVYELTGNRFYPSRPENVNYGFTVLGKLTPLSVTITGPTSASKNTTSLFSSNVLGAQGNVSYQWEQKYQCCGDLPECGIYYLRGYDPGLSIFNSPIHYDLRLTVWDAVGRSAIDHHHVTVETCVPGGSGCPTLAFESDSTNDSGTEDENSLLISSPSYPTEDVVDYYLIQSEVSPDDSEIHFLIHEPQTEHTWLDKVEIIEVEVNQNDLVAVTDNGEIVNYTETYSPIIILNEEIDVSQLLGSPDENSLNVSSGDILSLELSGSGNEDNNIFIILEGFVTAKNITADLMFLSSGGEETYLGNLFLRQNTSVASRNLGIPGDGILQILFNQEGTIDYLTLVNDLNTAEIESLEMTNAFHSTEGDVLGLLIGNPDQQYAEIFPEQEINFSFREGTHTLPKIRYILKTVGRYEIDTTDASRLLKTTEEVTVPRENKLYANYPNPFNPTTEIKYSLKDDGLVILKIYDALGNEVAVLMNQEQKAGTHTIKFDATKLSSGIYFYSLMANSFFETKKMMLLK